MGKIMIGYYSKTGSTKKVCTIIKEVFQAVKLEADMKEFSQIKELESYDTVILAAPINGMQLVEVAKSFIAQNADVLQKKKAIIVYVSYIFRTGSKFWRKTISKGIESTTKPLNPMLIKEFGGVIDVAFPAFARWIFGIPKMTPMDISDDKEVETFAKDLINKLQL